MLMALDMFAFEIGTLPFQELQRRFSWRFAKGDRVGVRPASQFLGPGDESVDLSGALYPGEGIGAWSSIDTLRAMADEGAAYVLTSGTGDVLGDFVITGLDLRQGLFFVDGAARTGDFSLSLERVDSTPATAADSAPAVATPAAAVAGAAASGGQAAATGGALGDIKALAAQANAKMQAVRKTVSSLSAEVNAITTDLAAMGIVNDQVLAGMRTVTRVLMRGAAASTLEAGALRSLGVDPVLVAATMAVSPKGAMKDVLGRIGALPTGDRGKTIAQLFGATDSTFIGALAGRAENLL